MEDDRLESNLSWIKIQCGGIFTETFWASDGDVKTAEESPFEVVSSSGITRIDDQMKTSFDLFFGDMELLQKGKKPRIPDQSIQ